MIIGLLVSCVGVYADCRTTGNFTSSDITDYSCSFDAYFEDGWEIMSDWGIEKNVSQVKVDIESSMDCKTPGQIDNESDVIYINYEYTDCYSKEENLKKATAVHETAHIAQRSGYGFTNIEDWWADASAVALEELVYDDADDYWQYLSYETACSHDLCVKRLRKVIENTYEGINPYMLKYDRGEYTKMESGDCSKGCISYHIWSSNYDFGHNNYCWPCPKGFFDYDPDST